MCIRDSKTLEANGDTDDGDAVENTEHRVGNRHGQAGQDEPEYVGDKRRRTAAVDDRLPEGRQRERCHLKALPSERNANDGDGEHNPRKTPPNRRDQPAEDDPDYVRDNRHQARASTLSSSTSTCDKDSKSLAEFSSSQGNR